MIRIIIITLLVLVVPGLPALKAQGYAHHRSSHIDLLAPQGLDVESLSSALEQAYQHVREYGLRMPGIVEIRCYRTTTEFVTGSGGSRFNLAMSVGQRVHLQPPGVLLRRGDEYARALRHELTHVALAKAAARGLPRWLNEGVALMVAGELPPLTKTFGSLSEVEKALLTRSQTEQLAAYAACRRLCDRLIGAYGKSGLMGLLNKTSGGGFADAFRTMTGRDVRTWCDGELRTMRK